MRMETSEIQIELTNRWMRRISIHHRQSEVPRFMSRRVFGVGSKLKGKTGKGLNSTGSLSVRAYMCACFCAERTILKSGRASQREQSKRKHGRQHADF